MATPGRHDRLTHIRALWRHQIWTRWLGGVWAALGFFSFFRDEFFEPADEQKWRITNMIPHFALAWWLCGLAVILIIGVFEASFRLSNELWGAIDIEHAARIKAEAELDTKDKKRNVKAAIGRYIDIENNIFRSCGGNDGNDLHMKEPAEAWVTDTRRFVIAAFGSGEGELLLSDVGYTFYSSDGRVGNWVKGRIRRLTELTVRVDSLDVDRDLDPLTWPSSPSNKVGGT